MLLSIIFSFRNEEKVLSELVKRVYNIIKPLNIEYELIFVNDSSSDGSLALLERHREQDKNIKIINMSRRFGIAPCIMAGLRYARGDAVIYMDADLQDPPELIPTLIGKWREGADVVHTTRIKRKGENPLKMWLTRQAYRVINLAADIDIPGNSGDFKLLSRRAVNMVIQFTEYDPFMRGLARWIGFKQVQLFYEREPRFAGKTHFSLVKSLNPAKEFVRGVTSFSNLPLYLALGIGFIVSIGAFIYLVWIIITKFMQWNLPGWSAMMVTVLFLGGIILCTLGIIGIYLGYIYQSIKNRPPYIIESKIGIDEDTAGAREAP